MPYQQEGSLTTDKRVVDDEQTWDAQSDWEAYQSQNNVEIVNGVVQLAQIQYPDSMALRYQYEDDSDSTVAIDSEGSADGSITGASYTTDAAQGERGLSFDGTDDYVESPYSIDTSVSFSWSTWVQHDSSGIVLGNRDSGYAGGFISAGLSSGEFLFGLRDSNNQVDVSAPISSGYQHIAGVYDANIDEMRIYKDGSKVETGDVGLSPGSGDSITAIGVQSGGSSGIDGRNIFGGLVDDTMFFTDALTDEQVQEVYNNSSAE